MTVSRVSQPTSRYAYGSSSSAAKTYQPQQQAHYEYYSSGYPRSNGSSAGRCSSSEVYAFSEPSSSWHREQQSLGPRLGEMLIGALFRLMMRCACSPAVSFLLRVPGSTFLRPGRPAMRDDLHRRSPFPVGPNRPFQDRTAARRSAREIIPRGPSCPSARAPCTRGGCGTVPTPRDISLAPDFLAYLLGPPQRLLRCRSGTARRVVPAHRVRARLSIIVLYHTICYRTVYLRCSQTQICIHHLARRVTHWHPLLFCLRASTHCRCGLTFSVRSLGLARIHP